MPGPSSSCTRRDFVRAGAAAAAVLASPAAARARARRDEPFRVGLIGCGGRGTGAVLQALNSAHGPAVLWAMGDVFADRLESSLAALQQALPLEAHDRLQVAPERRFVGFSAYERVIGSGVDVVLLATPPAFRPVHLAAAVEAGKHVFCEKPCAVDAPGVRSVLESSAKARQKGLALVSGFCWRYNVRHRELYRRVLDGALGEIRAVYSTYNTGPIGGQPRQPDWSDMEFQLRNWQNHLWLSGDHIVEQAVHSLDKMAWAFGGGPPLRVTAVGGRQWRQGAEQGNIYDHFGAAYEYPGGAWAFHMCRQIPNCSNDNTDRILGTRGVAFVDGWAPVLRIEGAEPWAWAGEGNDMYQQELDELFASVRAGAPIDDGEWMAHSTLLAIMARMAAYTGQTVSWEQALGSQEVLGPPAWEWGPVAVTPVPVPGQSQFL